MTIKPEANWKQAALSHNVGCDQGDLCCAQWITEGDPRHPDDMIVLARDGDRIVICRGCDGDLD